MKRILLACSFLALSGTMASAQTAKQTTTATSAEAAVEPRLMFSSRINELDAFITRKRPADAQKATQDLLVMMTNRMNQNQDQKSALAVEQKKLYTSAKVLSADPTKNHQALIETLHQFLEKY